MRLILDIDATLVTAHSEKEGPADTYKGGVALHLLLCFAATRVDAPPGVLHPGNAASNTASDHLQVLRRTPLQLPRGTVNPKPRTLKTPSPKPWCRPILCAALATVTVLWGWGVSQY